MSLLLKRLGVAVAIFVISGSAVLIGTIFLFVALYSWFGDFLRPWMAALATAGCLFGFAGLVVLLGFAMMASLRRKPRPRFDWLLQLLNAPEGLSAAAIGSMLGRRLQSFARQNTQATVIASLLAGLAVGFSPGLRALLRDILKD